MNQNLQKITDDVKVIFCQTYDGRKSDLATVLQIPLSELKLENRLITKDGMYVGGICNLELSGKALLGKGYLVSYALKEKIAEEEHSMQKFVLNILFGDRIPKDESEVIQDGKNYSREWEIFTGSCGETIIYNRHGEIEMKSYLIDDLKAKAINSHNVVISGSLMTQLFADSYKALRLMYKQLGLEM